MNRLIHPIYTFHPTPPHTPVYGDVSGFPPTLLLSGTRDLFLSNTVRVHRKLRQAGVPADLHVFEGAPVPACLLACVRIVSLVLIGGGSITSLAALRVGIDPLIQPDLHTYNKYPHNRPRARAARPPERPGSLLGQPVTRDRGRAERGGGLLRAHAGRCPTATPGDEEGRQVSCGFGVVVSCRFGEILGWVGKL